MQNPPVLEEPNEASKKTQNESRRASILAHSRRQSRFSISSRKSIYGSHGGIWNMLRATGHKGIRYENTYQLNPKATEKVVKKQLEELITEILHGSLKNEVYNPSQAKILSLNLSNLLRRKIHELNHSSRYKFIVQVHIGHKVDNSIYIASRSLWNPGMGDTHATGVFENSKIFAVGMIFALYYE